MKPSPEQLIQYFNGKLPADQKAAIESWMLEHPDPKLIEAAIREALATSETPVAGDEIPHEKTIQAYAEFLRRAGQPMQTTGAGRPVLRFRRMHRYMAAATILLAILGTYVMVRDHGKIPAFAGVNHTQPDATVYKASASKITTITLPDGSIAKLFPGSSLSVPRTFNDKDRAVSFQGRAFFDIRHDPVRPFSVGTGDIRTTVIGTSFEVNTLAQNSYSVVVKEGKVKIANKKDMLSYLTADQHFSLDIHTQQFNILPVNAAGYCHWTDGRLDFDQQSLSDVMRTVGQWYGVEIQIRNTNLMSRKLTYAIRGQDLKECLQVLSTTMGFSYQAQTNGIIIIQ